MIHFIYIYTYAENPTRNSLKKFVKKPAKQVRVFLLVVGVGSGEVVARLRQGTSSLASLHQARIYTPRFYSASLWVFTTSSTSNSSASAVTGEGSSPAF